MSRTWISSDSSTDLMPGQFSSSLSSILTFDSSFFSTASCFTGFLQGRGMALKRRNLVLSWWRIKPKDECISLLFALEVRDILSAFSISSPNHFFKSNTTFFLCVCKQSCLGLPDSGVPASISSWPGSHWECCRCRWSWTLWRLPTWCQPQDIAWAQWCCGRQLPHLTPIFWNNTQEIDGQQFYSEQPLLT